jgi:MFS family permease
VQLKSSVRSTSIVGGLYYGWVLVGTLGITETISWGVLYYAFSVFLAPMEAELGWSRAATTGAFSLALVISGIGAIPVGRWLDHRGPRLLMSAGACVGALLVLAWSRVADLAVFYLVWSAIGLVMATVLYEPAFAVVAVWFERKRTRALTAVTLIAGFSSTVFLPLAAWLVQTQGWRSALVSLAVILAIGTIPAHVLLLRRRPEGLGLQVDGAASAAAHADVARRVDVPLDAALRDPTFRWIVLAFCLSTAAAFGVHIHLVPILRDRGYAITVAAALSGVVGAMQVAGRIAMTPLTSRLSLRTLSATVLAVQPLALLVLLLVPGTIGVVMFVVLFGAAKGCMTLVRPAFVAELYGRTHYASIAGVLAFAATLAQAIAPVGAGMAFDALGRYEPILWGLVGVSTLAAAALLLARPEMPAPPTYQTNPATLNGLTPQPLPNDAPPLLPSARG